MTVAIKIAKPVSEIVLAPGSVMTVSDVSWQEYETILQELGDRRSTRLIYSNHTLQIMSPLPEHERPTNVTSLVVTTLFRSTRTDFEPFGSTTFKQSGFAGVEPDCSFYVGENAQKMRGRRRLEPGDPAPDLAIETDVTSKTAVDAYLSVGVPEIWVYASGGLKIYLLQNGQYAESETSLIFPNLPIIQLVTETVEQSWQIGTLAALEAFERSIVEANS